LTELDPQRRLRIDRLCAIRRLDPDDLRRAQDQGTGEHTGDDQDQSDASGNDCTKREAWRRFHCVSPPQNL
jgi:hypothetical protein